MSQTRTMTTVAMNVTIFLRVSHGNIPVVKALKLREAVHPSTLPSISQDRCIQLVYR